MVNDSFYPTDFYPDGLTPDVIDALIRDVADTLTETAATTRLSRPVLDHPTIDRRERRDARRTLSAVVRTLPDAAWPNRELADGDNDTRVPLTGAA